MGLYPIHEAYFGKTPEIQELASLFSKFRSKYVTGSVFKYSPNINTDEDLIKFNRKMEEVFGFSVFELYIINSTQMNAYTWGTSELHLENPKQYLRKTSNGIKYDQKANIVCMVSIYTGLLLDQDFTDDEVFTVILHEIGHNFQEALVSDIADLGMISYFLSMITAIIKALSGDFNDLVSLTGDTLLGRYVKNIRAACAKVTRNPGLVGAFFRYMATFKNILSDTAATIANTLSGFIPFGGLAVALVQLPMKALSCLFNLPRHIQGVAGEYSADSFPIMYGYGPEAASAERKLGEKAGTTTGFLDEAVQRNKVLNAIYQFNLMPLLAVAYMFDEHPTSLARVKHTSDALLKELNSEYLDPKMKKKIIEDGKKCQAEFDDFYNKAKNLDSDQKRVIFNGFQAMMYDATGSDNKQWIKNMIDVNRSSDRAIRNAPDAIQQIRFK